MRFVHAADLHLDSPLQGLSRLEDADVAVQLRQASRRALENLVRLVLSSGAQALVLAGDIYDGDWPDYATGRFFAQQMAILHDHHVPVYSAAGNHDADSVITRSLTLPPNVTVMSTYEPETVVRDDLGLAVHGQGFATRAVTENLVQAYPSRIGSLVNVGILHTAVAGAEGHATYAPCTPEDLQRTEYDYLALGHVHEHRIVNDGHRVAAFSGNLQGRHPKETGPKGALVVDVEPDGRANVDHVALDVARWAALSVDATDAGDVADVLSRVEEALRSTLSEAGQRLLVVRVTITGVTRAAADLADRERLHEEVSLLAGRLGATLERARSSAQAPSEEAAVDPELLGAIQRSGQALAADGARLRKLARPIDQELGRMLRAGTDLDLRDEQRLAALAREALAGLTARLAGQED